MRVAIRVDASIRIGLGHLMRCRTLATALRDQGTEVRFICRAHPGHGIALLQGEDFAVATLPAIPAPADGIRDGDYAGWLGVSQERDARETLTALADWRPDRRPDWLIVDHYGLDQEWEHALCRNVGHILVIDDLANRRHDADLLLDQNYAESPGERYAALLPQSATRLLGPRYALLRPEYARYRRERRPRGSRVHRVLVFFGGTDPDDLTGRTLTALDDPRLVHLQLDLVVGANNPQRDKLAARIAARPGSVLHGPRPHLADLMSEADLAIGAGGATLWERCCVGLPSLVASIAENQRPACMALAAREVIDYLGHHDRVSQDTVRTGLQRLIQFPAKLQTLTANSTTLVDGRGVVRVIQAIQGDECHDSTG